MENIQQKDDQNHNDFSQVISVTSKPDRDNSIFQQISCSFAKKNGALDKF